MARPPFVLFGFDVDEAHPDRESIRADVEAEFPAVQALLPGGPADMHVIETTESQMIRLRNEITLYLRTKDEEHAGVLRYCIFLIRMPDGVIV